MMDGADPAGQELVADGAESGGGEPARERVGIREREHGLWQVGIGVPMFRHRPADRGEHAPEVEQIQRAQRREPRRGELEHHETRSRPEHTVRLPQTGVQIRQVPDAERAHRAVEPAVGEGQRQGVGGDRKGAGGFPLAPGEHGDHEVRADHPPRERRLAGERRRQIERAGAEVEVGAVGGPLPGEPPHRGAAPGAIHVETQEMIEEVVARGDRGEHVAHVRSFRVGHTTHGHLTGASDQDVVEWAKRGHEAAFRELVRRYERPVFSLLYRMVRDRGLAEDLAQETFIKVLNGLGSYNPQFRFSSWIFKIANNAAIDQLRKRELDTLSLDGSPHATTPEAMRATTPQLGDKGETPLQELEARELGGAIERAIARLRPEYRSCILLRHVEGHSYEEIAQILELPLGTVKTYIHRARNELRGYLADRKE